MPAPSPLGHLSHSGPVRGQLPTKELAGGDAGKLGHLADSVRRSQLGHLSNRRRITSRNRWLLFSCRRPWVPGAINSATCPIVATQRVHDRQGERTRTRSNSATWPNEERGSPNSATCPISDTRMDKGDIPASEVTRHPT